MILVQQSKKDKKKHIGFIQFNNGMHEAIIVLKAQEANAPSILTKQISKWNIL